MTSKRCRLESVKIGLLYKPSCFIHTYIHTYIIILRDFGDVIFRPMNSHIYHLIFLTKRLISKQKPKEKCAILDSHKLSDKSVEKLESRKTEM